VNIGRWGQLRLAPAFCRRPSSRPVMCCRFASVSFGPPDGLEPALPWRREMFWRSMNALPDLPLAKNAMERMQFQGAPSLEPRTGAQIARKKHQIATGDVSRSHANARLFIRSCILIGGKGGCICRLQLSSRLCRLLPGHLLTMFILPHIVA